MLTRNNVIWTIGKLGGLLALIASHAGWLHVSPDTAHVISDVAVFITGGSFAMSSSPLPHSESPNQAIEWKRLLMDQPITPPSVPVAPPPVVRTMR